MTMALNDIFDPIIILAALLCGMVSRAIGLPALIGYLAAGFVLHEVDISGGDILHVLADMGITLLLFTIGLKLQPGQLLKTNVWGTTVLQIALMQLAFTGLLFLAGWLYPVLDNSLRSNLVVAFALTFSSTVFVIQLMQERGEMASRHANLAVAILILQDLAAVGFLVATGSKIPDASALLLLLLIPLRPLVFRLLAHSGHGELFTLFGLVLAIGGAALFQSTGIKGDLGALLIGAALAGHQKSKELARNLLQFKDLFLVGFFLSIGLDGWPRAELVAFSIALGLLVILKPPVFFLLMTRLHTPPRTALLSALSLGNYSEFGLIVIAMAAQTGWIDGEWTSALSLAIAVSFLLSSLINRQAHVLYQRWRNTLERFETRRVRERHPDTSDVKVIVLGMGIIGTGAYDASAERYGRHVLGIDENDRKLNEHRLQHRRVAAADASDPDFWQRVDLENLDLVMLALTNHQENLLVARLLQGLGYSGRIAAVVRFSEEAEELEALGVSAFNLYAQAGAGFAAHAEENLGLG
jgi:predicted Kef-type K+ transport protein